MKTLYISLKMLWAGAETPILKLKLIANFIFAIVRGILSFFIPLSLAWLVKSLTDNSENAIYYFWLLLGLSLGLAILKFIRRFFLESTVGILPINIKVQYYKKLFNQSYAWHLNNSAGFFLSALNQVCGNLQKWLQTFPDEYIPNAVLGILFFAYTWVISPWLFLFFVGSLAFIIFIAMILYKYRLKIVESLTRRQITFDKTFVDFLNNIRSIKKIGLLEFTHKNLNDKKQSVIERQEISAKYNGVQWGFIDTFVELLFLLPIGYFVYQMIMTGRGIDIIVLLTSVQTRIGLLTRNIMHFMENISETSVQYDILENHLERVADENSCGGKYKWNTIIFENTFFKFKKEKSIFTHFVQNFTVNRGDHIAVVGKSGEGKSTFLNILAGHFPIQGGKTKVDGKTFDELGTDFFTKTMSYISQDVELFDMTLYENITLGRHIPKKEFCRVIRGVCLEELVCRANGNLHINVGEKGVKVSAGEKQRISLARGLLLNKDILILDEITANLDADTTKKIWQFIFKEYKNKTIVAVSHETNLLKYAKRKLQFINGVGKEI